MKCLCILALLVASIAADDVPVKSEEVDVIKADSKLRNPMMANPLAPPQQLIKHYSSMRNEDFPVDYNLPCSNVCNCRTLCVMYWWVPCACGCPPQCNNNNEQRPPQPTTQTSLNRRPEILPIWPQWPEVFDPNNPNNHLTHPPRQTTTRSPWNPNPWNPPLTHPPQHTTQLPVWGWSPTQQHDRPRVTIPDLGWWPPRSTQQPDSNPPSNWWEPTQQPNPNPTNPPSNWWEPTQQPNPNPTNPPSNWWEPTQQPNPNPTNPPWEPTQQPNPNPNNPSTNWWDPTQQNVQTTSPGGWWPQPQKIEGLCDDTCSCVPCTIIWICPPQCSPSCCASRGFAKENIEGLVNNATTPVPSTTTTLKQK